MEEIMSESEKLKEEENVTETHDSGDDPVEEAVDYPQCKLSDVDVARIADAIRKAIIDNLKGD